jgi:UPF0755 protein
LRPLARALAILIAALVVIGAAAVWQVDRFLDSPVNVPADGASFEIPPGTPFARVSQRLAEEGIVAHPTLLRLYARVSGKANAVHAGEYLIEPGTTTAALLEQFTRGDVLLYSFTIIEGWNQWDLLRALHAHPHIDAQLSGEDWPALLEELGADTGHPEGLFLPETYHFPRDISDRKLLGQAYALMQTVLGEEWPKRDPDAPVSTPYEALILASIVEKETARPDERHRISGVFARRLEKRMRLQTDPTVIYGIGPEFNGNLTRRDLRTDTPYNTYTRGGLPPTPIAMPGRDAIRAALHPAAGKELFFVATGLGDGSHKFSETKAEHDEAVAEYLKQLRRNRQKGM